MNEARTRVAAIVGPTAAGKSAIAAEVAERVGAEIISVDSMQSYRSMDIGTDKPSSEMRARVPHHMIDRFDPDHELTVAEFQDGARACIGEVAARGKLPLLVGGSGLYFRAVVDDLEFPPRSPEVRAELESQLEDEGAEALHARLRHVDAIAAGRIDPANGRRTVRALEVIALTGRPFSDNDSWDDYTSRYDLVAIGLTRERPELFGRIETRVAAMLDAGLVEEARGLAEAGLSRAARQALGYRQVLDADADAPAESLVAAIVAATKRFARRQESWFRSDPRVMWFDAGEKDVVDQIVRTLSGDGSAQVPTGGTVEG